MVKSVDQLLKVLRELQAVDDRLGKLREGVAGLSLRVEDHRRHLAQLNAELQEKAKELRTGEKDSAKKELELKVIQEKIDKLKDQLRTVNSNKQYTALTEEIGGHEAQRSRTEDEGVAVMDRIDGVRLTMDGLRGRIEEAEAAVRQEEAAVAGEVAVLSGEIRELSAERQGLLQQLDKSAAEKYQRISHGRGGKAVVAVKDGVCQGCFMGVTKQTIARLWAKKELMVCPNCARIMYLEGEVQ